MKGYTTIFVIPKISRIDSERKKLVYVYIVYFNTTANPSSYATTPRKNTVNGAFVWSMLEPEDIVYAKRHY